MVVSSREINLTHGAGNGVDKACLMTASNMLIGKGEDGDNSSCVCPILRRFIITTNDAMPIGLLGELYGPLAWEIIGTRNDAPEVLAARTFKLVDWCFRMQMPKLFEGLKDPRGEVFNSILEIVDRDSAIAANSIVFEKFYAGSCIPGSAVYWVRTAVEIAADAAVNSAAGRVAGAAGRVAGAAACVANTAVCVVNTATACSGTVWAREYWSLFPEVIREIAKIGDLRPKEPAFVLSEDDIRCQLQSEDDQLRSAAQPAEVN